ncbi:glycosyltransferase family 4 protein [Streptomyces sp. NPDC057638]|uniref:glycosyltransferase family 4 protein n=1 Tax=Streptomyces sp. NPDC057638 TaxID=3346190 RepID=UPI00369AFFDB
MSPARTRVLTGIDLPLEPSCGSTIWCADVYGRLTPRQRTTFLALPAPENAPAWAPFEDIRLLDAVKRPYGPGFDAYVRDLTAEVSRLLDREPFDVIHAQHLGFGLALAFARAARGMPLLSIAHGTDVIAATENVQARAALNEIAAASRLIAVPTPAMAERVNALTANRHRERVTVLPWGIPLPPTPTHVPSAERGLRLLHAGRLDANKSTVTAIDALALTTTQHTLTVVGSGPELPALTARAHELGLDGRVVFTPFEPRQALWSRFADHDALLLTTRNLEAFGLVAVEAQAHGLPVLHSGLPGLDGILHGGALPYPPGDAAGLAARIDELADDPALRQVLAAAAAANARRHDITTTCDHLNRATTALAGVLR